MGSALSTSGSSRVAPFEGIGHQPEPGPQARCTRLRRGLRPALTARLWLMSTCGRGGQPQIRPSQRTGMCQCTA